MLEPTSAMACRNTMTGPARESAKRNGMARSVATDILLLKSPTRLDGIQVRRIGRHVQQTHAAERARGGDSRIMVGGKVVHHEHVTGTELGQKLALEPANKSFCVGCGEHRSEHDPSGEPNRSEHGQRFAPIHGNAIDELAATLHPRVCSAHRKVHARFVEENQLVGGDAADQAQELAALLLDVGAQTFQRPAAFFLRT